MVTLPPAVVEHYRVGYSRNLIDVITEARTKFPERDAADDLLDYLTHHHRDEELVA